MKLPLLVSLLIFSPFLSIECSSESVEVPAMYVFGDSLSDAGNNNLFPTLAKANFLPYGMNFRDGGTGRFTDGQTFADIIAGYLGLPYPPAYRTLIKPEVHYGYTYASGGCGILDRTGFFLLCMSLKNQINKFNETINDELRQIFENPTELNEHLSKSLFIIWAGSNDYLINYFNGFSSSYSSEQFAQLLVDTLSEYLKVLYGLGARKIVVLEVGPLGCIPIYRIHGGHNEKWCDESKNINATMFNNRLAPMVETLAFTYPDSRFTLGKVYSLSDDVFNNPSNYGMTNVSHPCCKTATNFGDILCAIGSLNETCNTPGQYLFFDGAHPTQKSFEILADQCFYGTGVCDPNIQELVQPQAISPPPHMHSAA